MSPPLIVIASIAGVLLYVLIARSVAGHYAYDTAQEHNRSEPCKKDWDEGWFVGFWWPIALVAVLVVLCLLRAEALSGLWKRFLRLAPRIGAEREALDREGD